MRARRWSSIRETSGSMADAPAVKRTKTSGASARRRASVRAKPAHDAHFTHFDSAGQAHVVDVAAKDTTKRVPRAGGRLLMRADTVALIGRGAAKTCDVPAGPRVAPMP